ncbi:MAG: hypothetical protein HN341_08765 [Verrucomicrobia bacterium]|jgi:hypothetical protein|nr:hypothetical protein [Verrucomicrobiota bacterium]MBT7068067.1 hypothetical protein [Verrucomicrobiota bacterium]
MKIISGGQTGVDRAALDVALSGGLPAGGWCPKGRRAEDGILPRHYPLEETQSSAYDERTEQNVRDSAATLIITRGEPSGGTAYTIAMAQKWNRPYTIVDLDREVSLPDIREWLCLRHITILNIAGPRESTTPGIYAAAAALLARLLGPEQTGTVEGEPGS